MASLRTGAVLLLLVISHAAGQTPVSMGHVHLNSADPAAQKTFWTSVIGAAPYDRNNLSGVQAPGALILFRQATPTGTSVGSSVNHIGFIVPALAPFYPKLDAAGYKYTKSAATPQVMIDGPDGVRIELTEDTSAKIPLRFHHVHFNVPDSKEAQAWYARVFGAAPGKRAQWDAADIPGANLTYTQVPAPAAPTAGRAIDHIGFDIRDLEAFCRKLSESGVKLDTPYQKAPRIGLALAFVTDPWGTRIELNEPLEK